MDRNSFATQKQIWWELDKLAVKAAEEGDHAKAQNIDKCMKYLEKPTPIECKRWYDLGY